MHHSKCTNPKEIALHTSYIFPTPHLSTESRGGLTVAQPSQMTWWQPESCSAPEKSCSCLRFVEKLMVIVNGRNI